MPEGTMPAGEGPPPDHSFSSNRYTPASSSGASELRRESSGIIECSKHAAVGGKVDATAKGLAMAVAMFWRLAWVRELPAAQGWLLEQSRIARRLIKMAGGPEALVARLLWFPGLCRLLFWLGERRFPGTAAHILSRKLWFQRLVSRALADGCRQVVVLGAGLDPRALHLCPLHPDRLFVELDLPATLRVKGRYLRRHLRHAGNGSADSAHNLLLLGQDLSWDHALEPLRELPAFDTRARTLVLAEGLLMYMPQDRAATLLRGVRNALDGPVILAFTCLDADPIRDQGIAAVERQLRRRRLRPLQWRIAAADLRAWLETCGLSLSEVLHGDALQARCLPAHRRRPGFGELMVVGM